MKKLCFLLCTILLYFTSACSKQADQEVNFDDLSNAEILEEARGTTINFYGWGGDPNINDWLDNSVAKELMEEYDLELNYVHMAAPEVIPKLLNEKSANSEGTVEVVWINGANFKNAMENGLLYGPFVTKVDNFNAYVDPGSAEFDFGFPTEGYEAPYGKAQLVFIGDTARHDEFFTDHASLLEFAKANPGKFAYPEVTDLTGSAFVRNIIFDIVGTDIFEDMEADKEVVRAAIQPALDYLNELEQYLWNNGETYPADLAQLDNMFSDGEIDYTFNYTPFHASVKIEKGEFPATAQTFMLENGTIGNIHFLAIPFNAPNKAGAIAFINHILSPQAQAQKYNKGVWGDLPSISYDLLEASDKTLFDSIDIGQGVLKQEEVLAKRLEELRADLVPIVEELWREEVLEK
jgi:putative spermidine/putrescine transport system substrate-binding protein